MTVELVEKIAPVQELIERDEFGGEEYIDRNASLPTVTVLNDQVNCGYFIPLEVMAKCGWLNFEDNELVSHTYRSGTIDQGILIKEPRMLICPKTELYQFDDKATKEQKSKVIVGLYNPDLKDDPNIKNERLYLVFFLDKDNKPLHTTPLRYAARGVNGTTFELERRKYKLEMEVCHALANQIPAKPKNDRFHSLTVFCFQTKAELVGKDQKSWGCRVVGHEKPAINNWTNYFVGYSSLKEFAWSALEPGQHIDVLSVPVLESGSERAALPAALETQVISVSSEEIASAKASLFQPNEVAVATTPRAQLQTEEPEIGLNDPDIPF